MNVFIGLSLIVLISVIANSKSEALNLTTVSSAHPKHYECSTSHKMWEISLEDFEAYCLPTFCDCFSDQGKCPPQWSADIFDGLAMVWYQQNRDYSLTKYCSKYLKINIKTTVEKEFIYIMTSNPYSVRKALTKDGANAVKSGAADITLDNGLLKPRLNTKGLWDIRIVVQK